MKKIALLAILVLVLLLSCDLDPGREVRFYASSTSGSVLGNYYWAGDFNMFIDEPSPWSVDVAVEKGDYVILTVTNTWSAGTVTARIYVDGTLFRENTGLDADIIQVAGYVE